MEGCGWHGLFCVSAVRSVMLRLGQVLCGKARQGWRGMARPARLVAANQCSAEHGLARRDMAEPGKARPA
jgi:hypothetical protein